MASNILFEDRFVISNVDNSKFEKVSRIKAKSTGYDAELILDVHSELFKVEEKKAIYLALQDNFMGKNDDKTWEQADNKSLNNIEYIMSGRIFKFEELSSERRTVYASYGGLMMALTADKQFIGDLEIDMKIYLLAKNVDIEIV
ncbi:DNA-directed RNA polymerases I, II, and III subunit RPABC3, putative [Plasmodium berghei]|uniref:DNA-directed RNA polymerases I, II, and III subunit RPABC3 n=2 Tax=Plasmodium berghei TaxID=5821 RepID=A0A509ARX3_PLABA|nr:DNA-directed RNA polymerases I, II, and III subunit RPABC3, putative [Plasmodium berghei ANKA]CXJ19109.1 DNA-directed RNA polymerases I, II, and III subunit RPABC3, putative [Plasmodium berghei]SCM26468.1 DNA-directed RNA polymerases I, II, and III subunit RPABC3, putative [Plasmodium berghei]SCN28473.1 DNA-directed RNA polymerases I, II, and III subunit RPABC3, putative [Plasmodium berghei]SCO62663.1 DNA-directed RNA polymerases I, II, and III subunit RPABC3, putative [Plasmodium berghei]S|eukprot:XP_034424119.1 DNA-directed RNA polymerases I, II, and III subunit RPABC3, putative [Plasmodium berghei ANKA]